MRPGCFAGNRPCWFPNRADLKIKYRPGRSTGAMHFVRIFVCLLVGCSAWAQNTAPNSLHPGSSATVTPSVKTSSSAKKSRFFAPRHSKTYVYKKPNVKHTARYEFYDRVEKAAREKKKILKKLSKPAYSDPRYFGHKRKPKKRPPHKMRYCDECSIRH